MSEIGAIELDDDLIARSIQGFASPLIDLPKPYVDAGYSTSSIAPVSPQYSPILMPPKENIMIKILRAHDETERLAAKRTQNFEVDAAKAFDEIERLTDEREAAFRKEMEAAKNRDSWSTLSMVSQYIASVSAVTLGFSLGGIPGFLLAIGGVAGGIVPVLNSAHLMQPILDWFTQSEKLQKSIKENIDTGTLYLQMGLGVAGGALGIYTGAFAAIHAAHTVEYLTHWAGTLAQASAVMNATGRMGAAYYNKHTADLAAQEREIDLGIFEERQELTHQTKMIGELLDAKDSETELVRKAIQQQEVQLN